MGLNRVWAATSRSNTRAMLLLERLHFVQAADSEGDQITYWHE
jgi:RimJ/RimL family protein N-acetyltransferase